MKKASSNEEYDGMSSFPPLASCNHTLLQVLLEAYLFRSGRDIRLIDNFLALAEHNRRRSSSNWSLHSSNNGETSKTDAIKDFFRRGSRSKRKSLSQDEIEERREIEDREAVEG